MFYGLLGLDEKLSMGKLVKNWVQELAPIQTSTYTNIDGHGQQGMNYNAVGNNTLKLLMGLSLRLDLKNMMDDIRTMLLVG